jgi:hypothetical protein
MFIKGLASFLIQNKIYIQNKAKTTGGVPVMWGEVFTTDISNKIEIGLMISNLLNIPMETIPHPENWSKFSKENQILKVTKIKNWTALNRVSKLVSVNIFDNKKIEFLPWKNLKGGHSEFLTDKAITLTTQDPEELGKTLLTAFDLCE